MIKKSTKLDVVLKLGEPCEKCGHCCQYGSGFLVDDDISKIAKFLGVSEKKLTENYLEEVDKFNTKRLRPRLRGRPYGKCVFFHDGCTIHDVKPLQCKVNNCSEHGESLSIWFMLNYFVNKHDPESIRQFKVYLDSGGKTLKGGELKDLVPDKKKLDKIIRYKILR